MPSLPRKSCLILTYSNQENWNGRYYGPHLFRPFQCCLFVNIGDVGGVLKIRNLGSAMVVTCQASISQVCASLSQELLLHRLSSHCIVLYRNTLYYIVLCVPGYSSKFLCPGYLPIFRRATYTQVIIPYWQALAKVIFSTLS